MKPNTSKDEHELEKVCLECGHELYSHNWTTKEKRHICIGENPYWSGCNCSGFKEKKA
jgi:hypothetical protein